MELYFLGTGAGMPSKQRNVTSIALNLLDERGTYWLFDCGEGTQQQIMNSPVKLGRTEMLFITHLHGDHLYGLPGLLTSRSYLGGDTPLTMFGPPGLKRFVDTALEVSGAHLTYALKIVEIEEEGLLFEDDTFLVETARLEHRIECFGYRIIEKDQPGKLMLDKLTALGIPAGPIYGKLKQGQTVQLEDGRTLNGADFLGAPIPGRIVVILGDTRYCSGAKLLARGADVLVHEATFAMDKQELAYSFDHATSTDAARIAQEAGANALIMTHISSRYQGDAVLELLQEAQHHHSNSHIAKDFWSFDVPRKD
ncbi:ribonuclease Z [Paenibacillus chondroitinus]|uniref:Ribonuclease Z n=1 Tax=Paenibacillus chondroitinus TaxID=59842 RepID=A0ABU6DDR7_9BACL|nr:ribonuclease Z [Paenibacillus chondroitinus]MCY9657364.1 ribonuclease Z [Paenibacillus anseongense]MEB4795897.1 ribonuclease Z [Paenibacillus chondroitinus]